MVFDIAKGHFESVYKKYLNYQKDKLEEIIRAFNNGNKVVILRAPVGFGKSIIGYALGRCSKSCFYITPQISLMDQLIDDFGSNFFRDIRGKQEYICNEKRIFFKNKDDSWLKKNEHTCDNGFCQTDEKYTIKHNCNLDCEYINRRDEAARTDICLMSSEYYLISKYISSKGELLFPKRDLVIIDEAHGIPQKVLKHHEFSIISKPESPICNFIPFFSDDNIQSYVDWINNTYLPRLTELIMEFDSIKSKTDKQAKAQLGFKRLKNKIEKFIIDCEQHPTEWVFDYVDYEEGKKITFKPLLPPRFIEKDIFSRGVNFLLMTATFSKDVDYKEFGLNESECHIIDVSSSFPIINRPIYYEGIGKMSQRYKENSLPLLAKRTAEILTTHSDERVIIHAHTYKNAKYFYNYLYKEYKDRLILQKEGKGERKKALSKFLPIGKEELTGKYLYKIENAVFISVYMNEGLDLKDDMCRCNIILKVPYPSLGDKAIDKRKKVLKHNHWYLWQTIIPIEQAYGRAVRSKEDKAVCYILDTCFGDLNRALFDPWFKEAIIDKSKKMH